MKRSDEQTEVLFCVLSHVLYYRDENPLPNYSELFQKENFVSGAAFFVKRERSLII